MLRILINLVEVLEEEKFASALACVVSLSEKTEKSRKAALSFSDSLPFHETR